MSIFSLRFQIWYWKPFKFDFGCLFRPIKYIRAKVLLFLTIKVVNNDMESKKKIAENHVNNISRLSEGWSNFPITISETKCHYYEFHRKLLNDLRLRILGNEQISVKFQNLIEILSSSHSSSQNDNFVRTSKNLLRNRY